jgi:uncharacterized membrane protein YjjB (DUF3815 family)
MKFWILLILSAILGSLIAWIDTRPTWDDTGITAATIIIVTVILGTVMPRRAWIWALAVGIWIPVFNIILNNNYGSLLALIAAFIGSYAGVFIRKIINSQR